MTTQPRTIYIIIQSLFIFMIAVTSSTILTTQAQNTGTITGELRKWHPIQISFTGEFACEDWNGTSDSNEFNPFLHRSLVVRFTNEGTTYFVPGFFNASGQTAFSNEATPDQECGNQWAVRFTPDKTGTWNYQVSYVTGENIAIRLDTPGTPTAINGIQGSFVAADTNKNGTDLRGKGFLRYVGEHYPRFDNGEYYIKTGADTPENFLGYVDFHNTFDHEVRSEFGPFVHTYAPHANDYNQNPGPLWGANQDTGRNIYGALNYLSSVGVNSVYMINYGIDGGDGGDVWPWSCPNELVPSCDETKLSFDISKLEQWNLVFEHMMEVGIQMHFVFTEEENDVDLNTTQWKLYFREMIARFAHHHAIIWNLGEENFWKSADSAEERWTWQEEQAQFIRTVDPYDHRITAHSIVNQADTYYDGLLGSANFEATSIQQQTRFYNELAVDLRRQSEDAGRKWIIYGDEQPDRLDRDLSNWARVRREALWGNLVGGGGGVQWYVAYQDDDFGDVNLNDFRSLDEVYKDSAIARHFFEAHVPAYWLLSPDNSLIRTSGGTTYALAFPELLYALYVENYNSTNELDLRGVQGTFEVGWYSVRTGRYEEAVEQVSGGDWVNLGQPPFTEAEEFDGDSANDYAIVVYTTGLDALYDLNDDGFVTPADAAYAANRVNTGDTSADVTFDGVVDVADVFAVRGAIGNVVPQQP